MKEFDGKCYTCRFARGDDYYFCVVAKRCNGPDSQCKCPTERRAALIAQLDESDREALETGHRVMLMEIGTSLTLWPSGSWGIEYYDEDADEWKGIKEQDGIEIMQDTALKALHAAPSPFVGDGEKGETDE